MKVHNARTTVREIRALFDDEHVHAAVIVEAGELLAVVDRADLETADDALALPLGRRRRRVIAPDADLALAKRLMLAGGRRRLAVVDRDGKLKGLLCLKRSRSGFCSDRDVRARSAESAPGKTHQCR
jgi:CBS domain-containing protein